MTALVEVLSRIADALERLIEVLGKKPTKKKESDEK